MLRWIVVIPIALCLISACATPNHFVGNWELADANGQKIVDWRKCQFTNTTVACEDPERGSSEGGAYNLKSEITADVKNLWTFTLRPDGNLDFYDGNGTVVMRRAN